MEDQLYPKLFKESDSLAIDAQKKYFRLVKAKILLMIIIAGIASLASIIWNQDPITRICVATISAIFLVVALSLSALIDIRKFDRIWFSSRAIAESVKTESWSFIMKVDPYDGTASEEEAEERFIKRLDEILHRQPSICSELAPYFQERASQITDKMRKFRSLSLHDRHVHYIRDRLADQKNQYSKKAAQNKKQQSFWLLGTWIFQLAAAAMTIVVIGFRDLIINPVGIITTTATGVLSWSQAKSFRELSQSYSLVSQELSLLEERIGQVSTEDKLADLVVETERTISREHTIWLARRF